MEKEEVLKKASSKRAFVGEMEKQKINKGNWISIISAGTLAVALMIIEGALGHISAIFAIAAICYLWAGVFYFCQYFIAKRPKPVLIGAFLHSAAFIAMIVLYILKNVSVLWTKLF